MKETAKVVQRAQNSFTEIDKTGRFVRKPTTFRNWIRADGSTNFTPASGRYHLYVSFACPWASRCLAFGQLKGITDAVPVHTVAPIWGYVNREDEPEVRSWVFSDEEVGGVRCNDPLYNCKSLRDLYELSEPDYIGRYTVPVLWDSETKKIVNNESSEIVQMFNKEFDEFAKHPEIDLRPPSLLSEIERLNDWMYETINNGVYKCGFATKQEAYEMAFNVLFVTLDAVEAKLGNSRFLVNNDTITEADVRLFVTIVRFDAVYVGHFKCNKKRIVDYPNIWGWLRDVYQWPGIRETVNITHIKEHYYGSHNNINPYGIIPVGPDIDFDLEHDRASRFGK